MKFSSKAQNLSYLKKKKFLVPNLYIFKVTDYKKKKLKIIDKIKKKFKRKIIVRSSSVYEDKAKGSMAGLFESVPNINPKNSNDLETSINKVIDSYKNYKNKENEIFIQEMIEDVKISGVVTSCDLSNYSPFYKINYSKKNTLEVTSGGKETKSYYCFFSHKPKNLYFRKIKKLIDDLKKIYNNNYIEIEFAISKKKIYLLQVRPIKPNREIKEGEFFFYNNVVRKIYKKIVKLQKPSPILLGKTTMFGVMPDWNPAEIIGIKPRMLALSLYKELITDQIWSKNRSSLGFKNIEQNQLMVTFFGTPYVDIRTDFNSWIPDNLSKKLSEKLVNYYLRKYKNDKTLHDKIEFEILLTCYTPSTERKLQLLNNSGFTKTEINKIRNGLKMINYKTINSLKNYKFNIEILKKLQKKIIKSKLYFIDKIFYLIHDCKKYGTISFAGSARCGFLANELLNSFVQEGILSKVEKMQFLSNNINTVMSEMLTDFNKMKKFFFTKKYGHLRPNTYDILTKNYLEGYNTYFGNKKKILIKPKKKFKFSEKQHKQINKFLKKSKLKIKSKSLILFIKESIEQREYAKFVFTKSIDAIFENLSKYFKRLKISHKNIANLDINLLLKLYYNLDYPDVINSLVSNIDENEKNYELNKLVKFPDNICSPSDILEYREIENKVNFFGNKVICEDVIYINKNFSSKVKNKIVCIDNADPGYDFLFNKNIKGLITRYGGANSHMSIRCAELSITSAIGVGDKKFEEIISEKKIEVDPINQKINKI